MVDDAKDRGVLKAGDGLGGLVVVGEDDELTGLDGIDHAGLGNTGDRRAAWRTRPEVGQAQAS